MPSMVASTLPRRPMRESRARFGHEFLEGIRRIPETRAERTTRPRPVPGPVHALVQQRRAAVLAVHKARSADQHCIRGVFISRASNQVWHTLRAGHIQCPACGSL